MKVETDLRLAIKSAERAQRESNGWEEKRRRTMEAINTLIEKRKLGPKLKAAQAKLKQLEAQQKRVESVFEAFGLHTDLRGISDTTTFEKAGGKYPESQRWSADSVIAQLAGATPKAAMAILARCGIKWV